MRRALVAIAVATATCVSPAAASATDPAAIAATTAIYIKTPKYEANCSGVLIAPDVVLTAGHCLANFTLRTLAPLQPGKATVKAFVGAASGKLGKQGIEAATWVSETKGITVIEDQLALVGERFDIAALRLKSPVTTAPIPIGPLPPVGSIAQQTGYTASKRLQVRFIHTRTTRSCKGRFDTGEFTLCAGKRGFKNPACGGDSGGPLVFQGQVIGILSGANGTSLKRGRCGSLPSIYTRTDTQRARDLIGGLPPA